MRRDTTVLDQLIAEMRKHAADGREAAEAHRANATSHWEAAAREAKEAVSAANMANGWDETAYALERGVITLGDATVLYDLREQLGGAQEAIDPRLPFAKQREQLAATDLTATQTWSLPVFGAKPKAEILAEAARFEPDDVVNVCDPEHLHWGTRGTVLIVRADGLITITINERGDMLTLPPSSLMHHRAFVAQMDAAEQQAAKDAEAADDVYTAEERADDDAWAEAASDYAASLEPGIEADL